MTLGSDWIKKVGQQRSPDGVENVSEIRRVLQDNETKAKRFLDNLRTKEVADSVAYCVSHAKPYIVLNAPLCILDSAAFSAFQGWAREQQLEARIFGITTERFQSKQEDCIALAIMPTR